MEEFHHDKFVEFHFAKDSFFKALKTQKSSQHYFQALLTLYRGQAAVERGKERGFQSCGVLCNYNNHTQGSRIINTQYLILYDKCMIFDTLVFIVLMCSHF